MRLMRYAFVFPVVIAAFLLGVMVGAAYVAKTDEAPLAPTSSASPPTNVTEPAAEPKDDVKDEPKVETPGPNMSVEDRKEGRGELERAYIDLQEYCADFEPYRRYYDDHWCNHAVPEMAETIAYAEIGDERHAEVQGP